MKITPYLRGVMGAVVLTVVVGGGPVSARTPAWKKSTSLDSTCSQNVHKIVERMQDRHKGGLKYGLDNQYIAVTTSGWLNTRMDRIQHLSLGEQRSLIKAVQDENKDRKNLHKILAQAYGSPQAEEMLHYDFAEEWLKAAEKSQWIVYNPHFKTFNTI